VKGAVLKAGDLRPLTDAGLLQLVVRMVMRSEPWCPLGGEASWRAAVDTIVGASAGLVVSLATAEAQGRALLDLGARGARAGEAAHVWQARNQAACVVDMGLRAAAAPLRKERWQRVRDSAKHAASIYALQAHAGRLAIDDAITIAWATIRADIPRLASAGIDRPTLSTLRSLAPLWPGREPAWARPG
jgi:hypothetical protein